MSLNREAIDSHYRVDETQAVDVLKSFLQFHDADHTAVKQTAKKLIEHVRATPRKTVAVENFLQEYGLTTPEGIALMCLAEALLRVPDSDTADKLIEDKITKADWNKHVKTASDMFLTMSSFGLMLSGKVMDEKRDLMGTSSKSLIGKMVKRMGEPVIRQALYQTMKMMGQQFVMGQTIDAAINRAKELEAQNFRYSYDMLGEGARTNADAARYYKVYSDAIDVIGAKVNASMPQGDHRTRAGISVKISAIHPQYHFAHRHECLPELTKKLKALALKCKKYNIGLTVDAEEADRLDLSLDLLEAVFLDKELDGWEGFGLALQAYQRRAFYVIDWLKALSEKAGRKIMVRLVKGAYWDTEIKVAQINGMTEYPVFTRKVLTDLSYNACAVKLLQNTNHFYPQLATHNAYTVATILKLANENNVTDFEFQKLHGMADPLYSHVVKGHKVPCRIYAPVGTHKDLLPYLVRRMLENGANSSFVNQIGDITVPIDTMLKSPLEIVSGLNSIPHPKIPLPKDLYQPERPNSKGYDMKERANEASMLEKIRDYKSKPWVAAPLVSGKEIRNADHSKEMVSPIDHAISLGTVYSMGESDIRKAMDAAQKGFENWSLTPVTVRAKALEKYADLLEENLEKLVSICVYEAGKSVQDSIDEVREAVDFCRYYAAQGVKNFANPVRLPGPTGEENYLSYHGRGVFFCVSPWNFPLAIFTGQVAAALMAGNSVLAKPAEQTSIIAYEAVKLMHQAGIPTDVLHLIIGKGSVVGPILTSHPKLAGVCFTGSTATAKSINLSLASKEGPIVPLIAETGGQNAMIVDNTALPEQVVDDVIKSAFLSAGQRCSALRVLFLQEEIANPIITMLKGSMDNLKLGDTSVLTNDIGPVIDKRALETLEKHIDRMKKEATFLHTIRKPTHGTFCAPHLFEIPSIDILIEEVFGPVLHVVRFKSDERQDVINAINSTGYGLTLGIHSRIDFAVNEIASQVKVGNTYINRAMTGAVVGVQPFGGEGLSGTGPKAGGPSYLYRFSTERVVSINTTASGGNASLISLSDK